MPFPRKIVSMLLAGGLVVGLPLYALHAANRESARASLARGVAALDRGDPRTARVELMNALKADPDWADARVAQARALLGLGDGIGAEAELDRARALGSRPGHTRHLMAHALLLQSEPEQAVREALAADGIPGQRGYALRIAGRAYMALGRMEDAGRAFGEAMEIAPRDGATWVNVGRFRLAGGDQAGAIAAAETAVRFAPGSADATLFRATLVRDQYGLMASLPWFDRALAIDPNFVPALTEYAATLADLGQAGRMLAVTRRIIALDAGNPRAFFLQALLAARAGNYGLARTLLAKTGGALDGSPATMLLRGILYLEGGSADLAAEQFETLLTRQPDNQRARLLLGRAQLNSGRQADAVATLGPIADRADADSYALTLAARAQELLDNRIAADRLLDRAARPERGDAVAFAAGDPAVLAGAALADPAAAIVNIPYIRALIATGQAAAAVDRARALQAANVGAPAAQVVLGDAWLATGRPDEAARAYERAANLQFSEDVALRLVSAWRRAGRPDKAARVLGLYLTQNPQSVAANRIAASAWLDAKAWDRAIALMEPLRARLGDNDALLMADLAWAWLGKGDARKALAYAANAYRLQPANPIAADAYGWMTLQAGGRGQGAVDLLEKAVALAPGHLLLRMHLDKAYARVGRKHEVLAAL